MSYNPLAHTQVLSFLPYVQRQLIQVSQAKMENKELGGGGEQPTKYPNVSLTIDQ